MCRIETSIHSCGHASMPIHEFCPRNPSRLLPNERGACQRGYERSVPLLPGICIRCLELLERQRKGLCLEHGEEENAVEQFVNKRQAVQKSGVKSCEVEMRRGSDVSEDSDGQGKGGSVGDIVLPVGVKGVKIAWQQ